VSDGNRVAGKTIALRTGEHSIQQVSFEQIAALSRITYGRSFFFSCNR
jgi:hypothetical protein